MNDGIRQCYNDEYFVEDSTNTKTHVLSRRYTDGRLFIIKIKIDYLNNRYAVLSKSGNDFVMVGDYKAIKTQLILADMVSDALIFAEKELCAYNIVPDAMVKEK